WREQKRSFGENETDSAEAGFDLSWVPNKLGTK
ncbi:MAG: hypothetical protein ACI9G1_002676, partial [Pirellulaceae bacterium]